MSTAVGTESKFVLVIVKRRGSVRQLFYPTGQQGRTQVRREGAGAEANAQGPGDLLGSGRARNKVISCNIIYYQERCGRGGEPGTAEDKALCAHCPLRSLNFLKSLTSSKRHCYFFRLVWYILAEILKSA